jgi:hypothetical protein
MINGGTGTFTYHDDSYDGLGDNTVSYAPLSDGLGDLTDGIIATANWFDTPSLYVGWRKVDPVITFRFDASYSFASIRIHFDDSSGAGGVSQPTGFLVDSVLFPVGSNPNTGGAPYDLLIDLGGRTTDTITFSRYAGMNG